MFSHVAPIKNFLRGKEKKIIAFIILFWLLAFMAAQYLTLCSLSCSETVYQISFNNYCLLLYYSLSLAWFFPINQPSPFSLSSPNSVSRKVCSWSCSAGLSPSLSPKPRLGLIFSLSCSGSPSPAHPSSPSASEEFLSQQSDFLQFVLVKLQPSLKLGWVLEVFRAETKPSAVLELPSDLCVPWMNLSQRFSSPWDLCGWVAVGLWGGSFVPENKSAHSSWPQKWILLHVLLFPSLLYFVCTLPPPDSTTPSASVVRCFHLHVFTSERLSEKKVFLSRKQSSGFIIIINKAINLVCAVKFEDLW